MGRTNRGDRTRSGHPDTSKILMERRFRASPLRRGKQSGKQPTSNTPAFRFDPVCPVPEFFSPGFPDAEGHSEWYPTLNHNPDWKFLKIIFKHLAGFLRLFAIIANFLQYDNVLMLHKEESPFRQFLS